MLPNQLLRCCDLLPEYFNNIDEWTAYLDILAKEGMNAVWVNPFLLAGNTPMSKTNPLTGCKEKVSYSIYAMKDPSMVDPRFSVVARDENGNMQLTSDQIAILMQNAQLRDQLDVAKVDIHTLVNRIEIQQKIRAEVESKYNKAASENKTATKNLKDKIRQKATKEQRDSLKKALESEDFSSLSIIDNSEIQTDIDNLKIASENLKVIKTELIESEKQLSKLLELQNNCIRILDNQALKRFTGKAKSLNITTMFDLVLNHVLSEAPIIKEHPEWFGKDSTYPDATAFNYSNLLRFHHLTEIEIETLIAKDPQRLAGLREKIKANELCEEDFEIVQQSSLSAEEQEQLLTLVKYELPESERNEIKERIPEIIESYWQPLILYYIDLGFEGARVDCVRKVPVEVRMPLYNFIKARVEHPIILEEALFSDLSPKQFRQVVKGAGATHITGSIFNNPRLWHGGLSYDYGAEEYYKGQMVENGGVVNFTGNHDHYSCAMKVCRELAFERLKGDQTMYAAYIAIIPNTESMKEIRKSLFIYSYMQDIIKELNNPDKHYELCMRFGKMYRDTLLTSMFSGSGGYFMLAGDEFASLKQPTVFLRGNGKELYPKKILSIFTDKSPKYQQAQNILKKMAENKLKDEKMSKEWVQLNEAVKDRMLQPIMGQIFNEINAGVSDALKAFNSNLELQLADSEMQDWVDLNDNFNSRWNQPEFLKRFANVAFIQEINEIITKLPRSEDGYWSEIFKSNREDILIIMRKNGAGFESASDLIIVNLNPDSKNMEISKDDLHKIGIWLQERKFNGRHEENPEFHKAYAAVMGSRQFGIKPANLYFLGNITLSDDLKEYAVNVNNRDEKFTIVVYPKAQKIPELLSPMPDEFREEPLNQPGSLKTPTPEPSVRTAALLARQPGRSPKPIDDPEAKKIIIKKTF